MKHDLDEDVRVSSKNDCPTQPDTWAKCIYSIYLFVIVCCSIRGQELPLYRKPPLVGHLCAFHYRFKRTKKRVIRHKSKLSSF